MTLKYMLPYPIDGLSHARVLGSGKRIFEDLDGLADGFEVADYVPSKTVAHVRIVRKAK